MKAVVVDTNVIAYHLLGSEHARESGSLIQAAGDLLAPSSWEAELANALWMATRHRVLSPREAVERLRQAERLRVHSISNRKLWGGALLRSAAAGIAVYDSLFVELAEREGLPLATFDQAILRAFPDIACRPRDVAA